MSKNIETYCLQVQMREDLMECYREVAPNCITQAGAWRKTVLHPAKRYYVTAQQTYQLANLYFQGRTEEVDRMMPLHKKKWLTLFEEVMRVAQEPEHVGKPLKALCRIAVTRPAPQFFIQPDRMKLIFINMKKKRYDEYGQLKEEFRYGKQRKATHTGIR